MSVLDTIATRLGYAKARREVPVPAFLAATGEAQQWSIPDGRLAATQAELYQRLSWVYGAVTVVSETAAGVVLDIKQRQGEKTTDIPNHPFELRLARPNPLQSRAELLTATYAYRALTGNAYWWLNRADDKSEPSEIWILPPQQVRPLPDGRLFLRGYEYDPGGGGRPLELPTWQVVHFKRFHPRNWFVGLSPIEAAATVAVGDLKMQEWNTNLFGKNNAKIPGAFAFADPIPEPLWIQMKAEAKEQWGGTNRSGPMFLRNVGKGGVEWVTMALSQKDMEFLAGRQFTKEEIFTIFAPGLASLLAVNATEANARAGKATFMEMAIWPLLCAVAEKITNDVLPAYGPDLVCAFEDPRITDRVLALREQEAFGRVHTVDEMRRKFYDGRPLGDERGRLLPAQIGPGTAGPDTAAPSAPAGAPAGPTDDAAQQTAQVDGAVTDAAKAARLEDLRRWRRKAIKRGGACDFESVAIPASLEAALKASLAAVGMNAWRFLKAEPDARAEAEQAVTTALLSVLEQARARALAAIQAGQDVDYGALEDELRRALLVELTAIAIEVALREAAEIGVEFDVAAVNAAALEWARTYTYDLVQGLVDTTRDVVARAIEQYLATPGMTEGELEALLGSAFGEVRARMIAITEVTRAYSMATNWYREMLARMGIRMTRRWNTANDERVCPVCGPLHRQTEHVWGEDFPDGPPAHVRCRCWETLLLERNP